MKHPGVTEPRTESARHRTSPLHARALVLVFAGMVAGIAGAVWWLGSLQARRADEAAEETLFAIADLRIDQVARWHERQRMGAQQVADTLAILGMRGGDFDRAAIETWLASVLETFAFSRIVILDRQLAVVAASPQHDGWAEPYPAEAARTALATGQTQFIDLQLSPVSGRIGFDALVPIRDGSGKGEAVALIETDPSRFLYPLLASWPTPSRTGETLLTRREGDEVLFLSELRHQPGSALTLRRPLNDPELPSAQAILGRPGMIRGRDYRGEPVLSVVRPVRDTPWFLVAKIDREEIHDPLRHEGWLLALAAVAAIAACGLATALIWRRHSAQMLRESEQDYRRLFNELMSGFAVHEIITDAEGRPCDYRFLQVNPAFERLTGLKAADIVGRRVLEVMPGIEPVWIERYGRVAITGEAAEFEEHSAALQKYFEVHAYCPERGKFAVLFRDVTAMRRATLERERLNRELTTANSQLEELLYAASHDLRAPLVNIEGFSERLEAAFRELHPPAGTVAPSLPVGRDPPGVRIDTALRYIRLGVTRMNQLIGGMLQLSRLRRVEVRSAVLDMDRLVRESLDVVRFQLQEAGAGIELHPLPPCLGDPRLAGEVFTNLIDNAIKYRSPTRRLVIRISGRIKREEAVYEVADNGIGIAPEHQEKIWHLFHRLAPEGPVPGDGLGLNIVRRLLDRQKGRVWIESASAGGSRFFVALPAVDQPVRTTPSHDPAS